MSPGIINGFSVKRWSGYYIAERKGAFRVTCVITPMGWPYWLFHKFDLLLSTKETVLRLPWMVRFNRFNYRKNYDTVKDIARFTEWDSLGPLEVEAFYVQSNAMRIVMWAGESLTSKSNIVFGLAERIENVLMKGSYAGPQAD